MKKNEFRKELVLILVLLCTTIAYAQKNDSSFMVAPADSTKDISLTQRVDSLEHELSYIKLMSKKNPQICTKLLGKTST